MLRRGEEGGECSIGNVPEDNHWNCDDNQEEKFGDNRIPAYLRMHRTKDTLCEKGIDGEEDNNTGNLLDLLREGKRTEHIPSTLENFSSKHDAIICGFGGPYYSHCTSGRPNHAEVEAKIRQVKFVSFFPIEFMDREVSNRSRDEQDQKDTGDWNIQLGGWNTT